LPRSSVIEEWGQVIERDGKTIVITGWRAWVTANGFLTTLPAVAPVQGSAQPSYNNQDSLPGFNKTLIIADKLEPPPALYAYLTGVWDHVMGSGSQQGGPGESGLCSFRECAIFRLPGRLPDRCGSFRG
jgi:hypothetical protein